MTGSIGLAGDDRQKDETTMNETAIAWTDYTFNFFSGCKKISPECAHCYAHTLAERHRGDRAFPHGFDLTVREHKLAEPRKLLKSKGPMLIFCESMSDIGLDDAELSAEERARLNQSGFADMWSVREAFFEVIEETPEHRYQVLTKRAILEASRHLGLGTNNHAELSAVRVALAITESYRDRLLVVRTDSQYTIGALTAPADPEPWAANAKLLGLVRRAMVGRAVQFEHVKGHAGIAGNERADHLAGLARLRRPASLKGAA